jgi:hypothetical protein
METQWEKVDESVLPKQLSWDSLSENQKKLVADFKANNVIKEYFLVLLIAY